MEIFFAIRISLRNSVTIAFLSFPESYACAVIAATIGECGICGWIRTNKDRRRELLDFQHILHIVGQFLRGCCQVGNFLDRFLQIAEAVVLPVVFFLQPVILRLHQIPELFQFPVCYRIIHLSYLLSTTEDAISRNSAGTHGRIGHEEIFDFDRLEKAFNSLHLEMTEENEIVLFNLHNHLVWHSFRPGENPVADAILSSAIADLLEEYNLDASCVPADSRLLQSNLCKDDSQNSTQYGGSDI